MCCEARLVWRGESVAAVPLSIEDYRKLAGGEMTLAEAPGQPNVPDFVFEPPRVIRHPPFA